MTTKQLTLCLTWSLLACFPAAGLSQPTDDRPADTTKTFRIGIIGLDTSHAIAFTKEFNSAAPDKELEGMRVVAAFPQGSRDIESSVTRVPGYTKTIRDMDVMIVDSIEQLLPLVDGILLESNDGRPHLEQALPVLIASKPVFIDKPVAGSLSDAWAIFLAAEKFKTPVFSSSSLRYVSGAQKARQGEAGDILGCEAYSPSPIEPTHPDLYWYGIHGVETLFTVMQAGCQNVRRISTPDTDVVVGVWQGGRIGTFRGLRSGKSGYGGRAFGAKAVLDVGDYAGYRPLVIEIARFFRTGIAPVSSEETLQIYAFMTAADVSKAQAGATVALQPVLQKARQEAVQRLRDLGVELERD